MATLQRNVQQLVGERAGKVWMTFSPQRQQMNFFQDSVTQAEGDWRRLQIIWAEAMRYLAFYGVNRYLNALWGILSEGIRAYAEKKRIPLPRDVRTGLTNWATQRVEERIALAIRALNSIRQHEEGLAVDDVYIANLPSNMVTNAVAKWYLPTVAMPSDNWRARVIRQWRIWRDRSKTKTILTLAKAPGNSLLNTMMSQLMPADNATAWATKILAPIGKAEGLAELPQPTEITKQLEQRVIATLNQADASKQARFLEQAKAKGILGQNENIKLGHFVKTVTAAHYEQQFHQFADTVIQQLQTIVDDVVRQAGRGTKVADVTIDRDIVGALDDFPNDTPPFAKYAIPAMIAINGHVTKTHYAITNKNALIEALLTHTQAQRKQALASYRSKRKIPATPPPAAEPVISSELEFAKLHQAEAIIKAGINEIEQAQSLDELPHHCAEFVKSMTDQIEPLLADYPYAHKAFIQDERSINDAIALVISDIYKTRFAKWAEDITVDVPFKTADDVEKILTNFPHGNDGLASQALPTLQKIAKNLGFHSEVQCKADLVEQMVQRAEEQQLRELHRQEQHVVPKAVDNAFAQLEQAEAIIKVRFSKIKQTQSLDELSHHCDECVKSITDQIELLLADHPHAHNTLIQYALAYAQIESTDEITTINGALELATNAIYKERLQEHSVRETIERIAKIMESLHNGSPKEPTGVKEQLEAAVEEVFPLAVADNLIATLSNQYPAIWSYIPFLQQQEMSINLLRTQVSAPVLAELYCRKQQEEAYKHATIPNKASPTSPTNNAFIHGPDFLFPSPAPSSFAPSPHTPTYTSYGGTRLTSASLPFTPVPNSPVAKAMNFLADFALAVTKASWAGFQRELTNLREALPDYQRLSLTPSQQLPLRRAGYPIDRLQLCTNQIFDIVGNTDNDLQIFFFFRCMKMIGQDNDPNVQVSMHHLNTIQTRVREEFKEITGKPLQLSRTQQLLLIREEEEADKEATILGMPSPHASSTVSTATAPAHNGTVSQRSSLVSTATFLSVNDELNGVTSSRQSSFSAGSPALLTQPYPDNASETSSEASDASLLH